jgi:hypothetical protein
MRKILWMVAIVALAYSAQAQQQRDTVIVELAKTSRVIFTIQDRNDLEILKHYNFQELFRDILKKLENNSTGKDTTDLARNDPRAERTQEREQQEPEQEEEDRWAHRDNNDRWKRNDRNDDDDDDNNWERVRVGNRRWGRTWQSFNFDLGTNNYLTPDRRFPDSDNAPHSVRPWGSWYFAANSIQRTRMGRRFFMEWGIGLSWYTFKFQKDNIRLEKTDTGVEFVEDGRNVNFIKSKLSMSFIQASLVPVLDFGDRGRKPRFWDGYGNSFRLGIGPYIGYRVSSRTKMVYNDGGREKDKDRDNFYLNNVRYGARLQLGFRSTDFFFNYDMNELFSEGKGPRLNAFSFGVIF